MTPVQLKRFVWRFAQAYHILYSIWEASPGYQNVAYHLKQEPRFWTNLLSCLTEDVVRPSVRPYSLAPSPALFSSSSTSCPCSN
jgi:hypothetical protein